MRLVEHHKMAFTTGRTDPSQQVCAYLSHLAMHQHLLSGLVTGVLLEFVAGNSVASMRRVTNRLRKNRCDTWRA